MRASTCSRKESPPTMKGLKPGYISYQTVYVALTVVVSIFWGSVDMPTCTDPVSLRIPGCLVLVKQLLMSLYDVSDGIMGHVYHTLRRSHLCVSRLLFYSHHSLSCIFFPHPVKTKNRREDLHVVVCPWVHYWAYCP